MASALKDVINAAAGITTFAIESARDLVQYMVRRGQMTQEEADKLIREAEAASAKRGKPAPKADGAKKPASAPPSSFAKPATQPVASKPVQAKAPPAKSAAAKPKAAAAKPAAKKAPAKAASRKPQAKK